VREKLRFKVSVGVSVRVRITVVVTAAYRPLILRISLMISYVLNASRPIGRRIGLYADALIRYTCMNRRSVAVRLYQKHPGFLLKSDQPTENLRRE